MLPRSRCELSRLHLVCQKRVEDNSLCAGFGGRGSELCWTTQSRSHTTSTYAEYFHSYRDSLCIQIPWCFATKSCDTASTPSRMSLDHYTTFTSMKVLAERRQIALTRRRSNVVLEPSRRINTCRTRMYLRCGSVLGDIRSSVLWSAQFSFELSDPHHCIFHKRNRHSLSSDSLRRRLKDVREPHVRLQSHHTFIDCMYAFAVTFECFACLISFWVTIAIIKLRQSNLTQNDNQMIALWWSTCLLFNFGILSASFVHHLVFPHSTPYFSEFV